MSDAEDPQHYPTPPSLQPSERLWTPWRMQYVGGGTREAGCVFCNRLAENDDVGSLILHRGPRVFAIMNLFPYNTGHAMILPNDHVASPEELDDETTIEMARYLPVLLAGVRRALGPGGFNVGMNLGSIAGAGIAAHLHQHLVPRWQGDANFMPVLANTKALPELIPVTYAKIRAELERGPAPLPLVALSPERDRVFVERDQSDAVRLPALEPGPDEALWSAGQAALARSGLQTFFIGWAGSTRAGHASSPALTYQAASQSEASLRSLPITEIPNALPIADQSIVEQALRHLRL